MVLLLKRHSLPFIVEHTFFVNCTKEYFIIFLPNKILKIGQIVDKPQISKDLLIKVDSTITIHYHKECLGKFIKHLFLSAKAWINNQVRTVDETLCNGEVILCTKEKRFTIEKKTEPHQLILILEFFDVHDLIKLLQALQSHMLFGVWSSPEEKVTIERFVAKFIESKNTTDIISVFKSLDVNVVKEELGKDLDRFHNDLLYNQIKQNLDLLKLYINLSIFNEKKKKANSKETQTGAELTLQNSINNEENSLIPSENLPQVIKISNDQ